MSDQFSGRPRSPTKCQLQVCAQLQGDTDSEAVWATIELDDWAELVSIVSSQGRQTRGRDHLEKERRIQEALADAQRVFPGRNLRPALEQLIDVSGADLMIGFKDVERIRPEFSSSLL